MMSLEIGNYLILKNLDLEVNICIKKHHRIPMVFLFVSQLALFIKLF